MPALRFYQYRFSLVFLLLAFSSACGSGGKKNSDVLSRSIEKRKSTPEGFLNHSENSLLFCLPDYMTPSVATGVKLVRFDALSRSETFELSEKPIVVKKANAFKIHYEDLLRRTEERSREFKLLSLDSAIINGARSRIIECELLSYGDPLKRHLTLVVIDGRDRFFTVKISCATDDFSVFKSTETEIVRSLISSDR